MAYFKALEEQKRKENDNSEYTAPVEDITIKSSDDKQRIF